MFWWILYIAEAKKRSFKDVHLILTIWWQKGFITSLTNKFIDTKIQFFSQSCTSYYKYNHKKDFY